MTDKSKTKKEEYANLQVDIEKCINQICGIILGKEDKFRVIVASILARGHVLLEDVPGVGKTTSAKTIAKTFELDVGRVQFTSDLLPSDITGYNYIQSDGQSEFRKGPMFCELLIADEINRTNAKTQSALLQGMEEGRITVEGGTYELPKPFIVLATQNPENHIGTHKLPESQLDRFMINLSMGYPNEKSEMLMIQGINPASKINSLQSIIAKKKFQYYQEIVSEIFISEASAKYAIEVTGLTRSISKTIDGLSPRALISWVNLSKAYAAMQGREFVLPDDLKSSFPYIAVHRIQISIQSEKLQDKLEFWKGWISKVAIR